ncbi:MAG: SMP-30/gluconolactonase/LRE family protein [Deltaproteobacteria bacterium]|nr:SMP-30/gluconolactonase/LRE family protein [Deltaproteobacteria bacterium]MBW2396246.1 SMP-30/gluconolactonase/LRE family protein [Deltaproteobacteria bacterium]
MHVLRWPEPPDVARIEFVKSIRGPADLGAKRTFWEAISQALGVTEGRRGLPIAQPADVEVSPDGKIIYVSDFAQGVVHVLDLGLGEVRYFGQGGALGRPFGLALDSAGNLWVAEQSNRQIRVIDPSGTTLRVIRSDHLVRPVDIALDEARGRLYVADGSRQHLLDHHVHVFDLEGEYSHALGTGRGTDPGALLFPSYLALDAAGNLYVSDTMNSRVTVFAEDGSFARTIGGRGDTFGLFDKPKGVAVDSFGNLYVVDSSWSNVQIFGPEDHVLLYFGGRGSYPGLLRNPTGITIGPDNMIYVGDYLNRQINIYRLVNTKSDDGVPLDEAPLASAEIN